MRKKSTKLQKNSASRVKYQMIFFLFLFSFCYSFSSPCETTEWQPVHNFPFPIGNSIKTVTFSPDGHYIWISFGDGTIAPIDVRRGEFTQEGIRYIIAARID